MLQVSMMMSTPTLFYNPTKWHDNLQNINKNKDSKVDYWKQIPDQLDCFFCFVFALHCQVPGGNAFNQGQENKYMSDVQKNVHFGKIGDFRYDIGEGEQKSNERKNGRG